jgi:hypothetical protein
MMKVHLPLPKPYDFLPLVMLMWGELSASFMLSCRFMIYIFENVDFVLDSKKVVDSLNKGGNDITEFGHVVLECKRSFVSYFENYCVEFSWRPANI